MALKTSLVSGRPSSGFTILELLIVVVILGIVAAIGVPSMRDLIAATRVKGAASDIYSSLITARSEAVKRNASVDVIPSDASNWGAGWSVRVTATAENLSVQEPVIADVAVGGPTSSIRYRGDGRLVDPSTGSLFAAEVAFTFVASAYDHIQMRCINIDPSGRPSVRTDRDRTTANGCN